MLRILTDSAPELTWWKNTSCVFLSSVQLRVCHTVVVYSIMCWFNILLVYTVRLWSDQEMLVWICSGLLEMPFMTLGC